MRARLSLSDHSFRPGGAGGLRPFRAGRDGLALYYERAVMSAAGARCGLFNPSIAAALAAAQAPGAQRRPARGRHARRAGRRPRPRQRPRRAAACGGPDVQTAAERVRQAFKAYAGLHAMTFPGDLGDWRAIRDQTVINNAWRLSQTSRAGGDRVMFGLSGTSGPGRADRRGRISRRGHPTPRAWCCAIRPARPGLISWTCPARRPCPRACRPQSRPA